MSVYLIADLEIHDADMYGRYIEKVRPIVKKYGGKYHVAGGNPRNFAGDWQSSRIGIIEFPSQEDFDACFGSSEYKEIAPLRENSTTSRAIVVDGLGNG